jgi:hypothetical protein
MSETSVFTRVEPDLLHVLEELRKLEPIFHRQDFGKNVADFKRAMAPEYWEVGASGRRYSGDFILNWLEQCPPVDAGAAGWKCSEFGLRRLGANTYLLTYTLSQGERLTRRATIWQSADDGWRILYHQGTVVSADEDDAIPPAWRDAGRSQG